MATQVQFRRGTTAEASSFTGAVGEVIVDTSKSTCVVHDGSKVGGYPLMREDGINSSLSSGSLASPALKFATSSNTGIYSPGVGQVALVNNGVASITIDGSGVVTIPGNAIISGTLTVSGTFNSSDNVALIVALS
jgi:hypothetical protein